MTLTLVRHSKAVGSHPEGDRHRTLSAEGRERLDEILPQVKSRGLVPDLLLSSPYLRAQETGTAFLEALGWDLELTECESITPEGDPAEALSELQFWSRRGKKSLVLFSHNPFITQLASLLLVRGTPPVTFHTPSIYHLNFEGGPAAHGGQLLWTLHPAGK